MLDTNSVQHYIRVMKNRMRKITLEESLARWARAEAARKDTSVSRLLADILKARVIDEEQYPRAMRQAMRQALARKPFFKSDGRYASRDELHDRTGER
jgi:hypothetical protein